MMQLAQLSDAISTKTLRMMFDDKRRHQVAGPDNITMRGDRVTFTASETDDMQGQWNGRVRAEIRNMTAVPFGEPISYRFVHELPEGWVIGSDAERLSIFDIHGWDRKIGISNVPAQLYVIASEFVWVLRAQGDTGWRVIHRCPLILGEPVEWRLDAVWHQSDGEIMLSQNGATVAKHAGPTCFVDRKPPYSKVGIYGVNFGGVATRSYDLLGYEVTM